MSMKQAQRAILGNTKVAASLSKTTSRASYAVAFLSSIRIIPNLPLNAADGAVVKIAKAKEKDNHRNPCKRTSTRPLKPGSSTLSFWRGSLCALLVSLAACNGSSEGFSSTGTSITNSGATSVVSATANTLVALSAATYAVAPSSSSGSGAPSSSSSGANGTPAALLTYINGLSGKTQHILSGQHSSYWDSNPLDYEQTVTSQTGKTVAILGVSSGQTGRTENTVAIANQWLAQGGIPLVSWWPLDPFTGQDDNDRSVDFAQLTQPGTAAYIAWYKLMDAQIAMLKQINGPVLYRPFVELNGNWFWWGDQPTAEMVTVWQQMHAYFVSQGVTNVVWVYNPNSGWGNYTQYYPGAAYVDVVSWDAYPPTAGDPAYPALVSLNKPIMLAETGVESSDDAAVALFSGDNSQLLATVKANFPLVFAVVIWCQNAALPQQNGEAAFMNDPSIISISDLPSGLVYQRVQNQAYGYKHHR